MRYIKIDPRAGTVTEHEHEGQIDWRVITSLIGCDTMTLAGYLPGGKDLLWVDDNGLLNGPDHAFFMPSVNGQPLMGIGIITGDESPEDEDQYGITVGGDITPASTALAWVQAAVTFLDRMEMTSVAVEEEEIGGVHVIRSTPTIEPR